jgi:hypothetical protein
MDNLLQVIELNRHHETPTDALQADDRIGRAFTVPLVRSPFATVLAAALNGQPIQRCELQIHRAANAARSNKR